MKRAKLAPAQLALLTAIGGFLMTAAYVIPVILRPHYNNSSLTVRALLLLPVFILGIVSVLLAATYIRRGIKDNSWSPTQITPLESFVRSPLWRVAMIICGAMIVCSCLVNSRPAHQLLFAGIPLWLTLSTFENALRTNTDRPSEALTLVPPIPSPLRSEHWGNH